MPTIRLIPSTYYLSDQNRLSISNASNMYANTDSTTYATVTNGTKGTTTCYIYIRGFNFNAVPSGAIVNSFTVKFKAKETGGNVQSSYGPKLCNGTAQLIGNSSPGALSTSIQTFTFSGVSDSWDDIVSHGENFGIRINCRRASNNTQATFDIYGAEIEVNYTGSSQDKMYTKTSTGWTELQKAFKKTNGSWAEQTDLTNVFESDKIYVRN